MAESNPTTFPKLLLGHARERPDRIAMREKDLGIWQCWTWQQVRDEVVALAAGLAELGFTRDASLAIIGDNRPRLYWSMAAAQCLGGIPVPMYQDAVTAELQFVMQDAGVRFVVAEDQEQVDKLIAIRSSVPGLEFAILYHDPRGMKHYRQAFLHCLDDVQRRGRDLLRQDPEFVLKEIERGTSGDICVMLYTSGTTGKPKGVCLTHGAFTAAAEMGCSFDRLGPDDSVLSYLPMAWGGDHLFSYAQALYAGYSVNCPESGDTVMTDMFELCPTYYFAPPRVFENLLTQVMIRMEDAAAPKRWLFHYFMGVARRCGSEVMNGASSVSFVDRVLYALGELFVYGPLRNVMGMRRIRVGYTAGAAIGPDLFRFYRSIGVNLKQLYGLTETCATACLQPDEEVKFDTAGRPVPGVEVRIAQTGEILVRSPAMMKEYFQQPAATSEAIDAEGFFHTGDAGFLDKDGHLKIIDRARDIGRMSDGALYAPNYCENKLKFFSFIKEAVTFGDKRDHVCAIVNIDLGAVGNWAERRNIAYSSYADLAQRTEVYDLVRDCIEKANAELAADEMLCASQVRRFLILHKELDPDDGELTRTRKVRRSFVAEKYAVLIEALYSGKTSQYIETQAKFEDGRTAMVAADLRIMDVRTFSHQSTRHAA